jgi:hypothetical protein
MLRRLLWYTNRTRLAWVIKAILSLAHMRDKSVRRAAARAYRTAPSVKQRTDDLESKGHTNITSDVDNALTSELIAASLTRVANAEALARQQVLTHKSYWVRLLDADLVDGRFLSDSIYVRFALQPAVISVLATYLGEMPKLIDVLLTLSWDTGEPFSISQLWHKDYDDVRTLKVFTYLSDVQDTEDGPFTLLPKTATARVGFTLRSHVSDAAVFSRVTPSEALEIRGPKGTTFICETSRCLHAGSRLAPGHSRLMYTATFISTPSVYPGQRPRFSAAGPLSAADRLVLDL